MLDNSEEYIVDKITSYKVNFLTGNFEAIQDKIKIPNFTKGEAIHYYRQFLINKGYKENIGFCEVESKKYGKIKYLTLFNIPIEIKFVLWQAQEDTEEGKAVFWIGERNVGNKEQVDYGIIIQNRIIPAYTKWYGLIVTPREFKKGMILEKQDFVDYLLVPLEDIINQIKEVKKPYLDIRHYHRKKYNFDNIIKQFRKN